MFNNNFDGYISNSCLWAKSTKIYHQDCQKQFNKLYQFMHINLVEPIHPVKFLSQRNFFTFIKNATRMTKTYTETKKSNLLKYLKIYYNICRIKLKENHAIKRPKLDYKSKLQSHKGDKCMPKKGIIFQLSTLYF